MTASTKKVISLIQMGMLYGLLLWFGPEALRTMLNLYVLVGVGTIAILYQPGFSALESGPSQDRGTAAQILWTIQGTQLLAHLEAVFVRFPSSFEWTALAWFGLVVMVAGLLLRTWSVIHLGAAFTWHIDPDAADEVISTGPFAVVRHPSYVGAFFLYVNAQRTDGVRPAVLVAICSGDAADRSSSPLTSTPKGERCETRIFSGGF